MGGGQSVLFAAESCCDLCWNHLRHRAGNRLFRLLLVQALDDARVGGLALAAGSQKEAASQHGRADAQQAPVVGKHC